MGHDAELSAAAGVDGGEIISNGSATDFDCDDLTGWTDDDLFNGISTQETFDSRSTFKLDGGTPQNNNNKASRIKVLSVPGGDRNVITFILYHDSLGASTASKDGGLNVLIQLTAGYFLVLRLHSDNVTLRNWAGVDAQVGSVVPIIGDFYNLTMDITGLTSPATAVCDFYLGGALIDTAVECSRVGALGAAGYTSPQQIGREDSPAVQRISYVDRILYGDNLA